jgi:hypothetical protein
VRDSSEVIWGIGRVLEKNFYRLPFTPPSLVRRFGPSGEARHAPWRCGQPNASRSRANGSSPRTPTTSFGEGQRAAAWLGCASVRALTRIRPPPPPALAPLWGENPTRKDAEQSSPVFRWRARVATVVRGDVSVQMEKKRSPAVRTRATDYGGE